MQNIAIQTLQSISLTKILMILTLVLLWVIRKNKDDKWYFLTSASIILLYTIIAYPLKNFFWGGAGDELFVGAGLQKSLSLDFFKDFYYSGLPPFYPPLYFWVVGGLSSLMTASAITAGKIGVVITLGLWFFIPWVVYKKSNQEHPYLLLLPLISLTVIPFQDIITKPYEAISALGIVLWFAFLIKNKELNWKKILFFGISGGLLFITYYFWWFVILLAWIIYTILNSEINFKEKIKQWFGVGIIMIATVSIYLIPLLNSYLKFGLENWQGRHLVPFDFTTFNPFNTVVLSLVTLLAIYSLVKFNTNKIVKACLFIILASVGYQFFNHLAFVFGLSPMQMLKPFHFLVTITLSLLAGFGIHELYHKFEDKYNLKFIGLIIFFLLSPFVIFLDNPNIQARLSESLKPNQGYELAQVVKAIPNLNEKIFLSSGTPSLNLFIPMNYFIAHNAHFSHHASLYSKREEVVKNLSEATSANEFLMILNSTDINSMILFLDEKNQTFPINLYIDNWPNGGKEIQYNIKKEYIDELNWSQIYNKDNWVIITK